MKDHVRKRYIILRSDGPVDAETRKEFTRMVRERYPDLAKNRLVWLEDALIVRTDQNRLKEMERTLALRAREVQLVPMRASGSISKLKRLAVRW